MGAGAYVSSLWAIGINKPSPVSEGEMSWLINNDHLVVTQLCFKLFCFLFDVKGNQSHKHEATAFCHLSCSQTDTAWHFVVLYPSHQSAANCASAQRDDGKSTASSANTDATIMSLTWMESSPSPQQCQESEHRSD